MISLPNLESEGDHAFDDSYITNFNFAESMRLNYIGLSAFGYTDLEHVDLHNANQLTELNDNCFIFCDNLVSVKLLKEL